MYGCFISINVLQLDRSLFFFLHLMVLSCSAIVCFSCLYGFPTYDLDVNILFPFLTTAKNPNYISETKLVAMLQTFPISISQYVVFQTFPMFFFLQICSHHLTLFHIGDENEVKPREISDDQALSFSGEDSASVLKCKCKSQSY